MRAIYIANLQQYNQGSLVGFWLETTGKNLKELLEEVPVDWEEWIIADSEGLGEIGEYTSLKQIADLEEAIDESCNPSAFLAYRKLVGHEYANPDSFELAYCGEFNSDEDFAWQVLCDFGIWDSLSEVGQTYFDIDKYKRDLMFNHQEIDGYYFTR